MKDKWTMRMVSIQYDTETTESVLDTEVAYFRSCGGDMVIAYAESEATGMDGSQTEIRISEDNAVSIIRTGPFKTHLIIQDGKKHFCHYETPFGSFTIGVEAAWLRNGLSDEGGVLAMRYTVDAGSAQLTDNEIRIRVQQMTSPKQKIQEV